MEFGDTRIAMRCSECPASELIRRIAAVILDHAKVLRSIWLCDRGLKIIIDNDMALSLDACMSARLNFQKSSFENVLERGGSGLTQCINNLTHIV